MNEMVRAIASLYGQFSISATDLDAFADRFVAAMEDGLAKRPSRLKMLPSFLGKPTGKEQGVYLVLDFGGSNLRLLTVELCGNRQFRVLKQVSRPLRELSAVDITAADATGPELFDAIAAAIGEFVPEGEWKLGHTFSFPCNQYNVNRAELIRWTKEIATAGVEGQDITQLLADALAARGLARIQPVAVINDTVGAYLAAAYVGEGIVAGAICGTGHNVAYLEPAAPGGPMAINMESGNFDPGMGTVFDLALDRASEKPGQQLLEKQVGGRYLGEIFRLILVSLRNAGILQFDQAAISEAYSVTSEVLSSILADESSTLLRVGEVMRNLLGTEADVPARRVVKAVAALVVGRSARLAGAAFLGVLRRLDPTLTGRYTIAVDGSLYEKMPGYRETIEKVLVRHAPLAAARTCLVKDGSGIGAAVAAAMASAGKQ